jgi:uncharacterized membrane protein YbaN (DUF454 family)
MPGRDACQGLIEIEVQPAKADFFPWLQPRFSVVLCCFQAIRPFQQLCRRGKAINVGNKRRECVMNLTTITAIAMAIDPTTIRVGAAILCVIVLVIIIARRKKMASKRRPIP